MPTIDVNGTSIFYQEFAAEDATQDSTVVLCLHSLFLDGSMFEALAIAAPKGYRVLCPDFRGQGKSARGVQEVIDMETLAQDLDAFIDALALTDIHAVAQSMGGDVLIRVAAKRPEQFRSLALLGTSACSEPEEQLAFVEEFAQSTVEHGFTGDLLKTLMEIMFGESSRADANKREVLEHWRSHMHRLDASLGPAMRGVVYRSSVVDQLPFITTPALVISGAQDMVRPGDWADELAHGLPNVRHVRLPRVGHSVILEAPEQTISEILQFVEAHR